MIPCKRSMALPTSAAPPAAWEIPKKLSISITMILKARSRFRICNQAGRQRSKPKTMAKQMD